MAAQPFHLHTNQDALEKKRKVYASRRGLWAAVDRPMAALLPRCINPIHLLTTRGIDSGLAEPALLCQAWQNQPCCEVTYTLGALLADCVSLLQNSSA